MKLHVFTKVSVTIVLLLIVLVFIFTVNKLNSTSSYILYSMLFQESRNTDSNNLEMIKTLRVLFLVLEILMKRCCMNSDVM